MSFKCCICNNNINNKILLSCYESVHARIHVMERGGILTRAGVGSEGDGLVGRERKIANLDLRFYDILP